MTATTKRSREQLEAELTAYQDRLDAAAAQGKAAYDQAFENPPDGIGAHEIDLKKVILRVNREELRMLGYRADQMVGHVASEFIVMQDYSQRAMDKKLSGDAPIPPFVRAFKRPVGACTMLLIDRRVRDAQGRVVGIRTVLTQID